MFFDGLQTLLSLGWRRRRTWRFVFQYLWNGWSDFDTWNVDSYLANKAYPVMKRYAEIAPDVIVIEDDKELNEVVEVLKRHVTDEDWNPEELQEKFFNHAISFWW